MWYITNKKRFLKPLHTCLIPLVTSISAWCVCLKYTCVLSFSSMCTIMSIIFGWIIYFLRTCISVSPHNFIQCTCQTKLLCTVSLFPIVVRYPVSDGMKLDILDFFSLIICICCFTSWTVMFGSFMYPVMLTRPVLWKCSCKTVDICVFSSWNCVIALVS